MTTTEREALLTPKAPWVVLYRSEFPVLFRPWFPGGLCVYEIVSKDKATQFPTRSDALDTAHLYGIRAFEILPLAKIS